jgi:hypothetical protein
VLAFFPFCCRSVLAVVWGVDAARDVAVCLLDWLPRPHATRPMHIAAITTVLNM